MTEKTRQKSKFLDNEKSFFKMNKESIFITFKWLSLKKKNIYFFFWKWESDFKIRNPINVEVIMENIVLTYMQFCRPSS